jgi:cytochrome c oxidase subunit 4
MTMSEQTASHGEQAAPHSLKPYIAVFSALLVLTAVTVGLSYVDIGKLLGLTGLIVALVKASLVVWIFMHQDHEEGINRFILGFSICLLGLAFLALSTDFLWLGTYVKAAAGAMVAGK